MAEPATDGADRPPGLLDAIVLRALCQRPTRSLLALKLAAERHDDADLLRLIRQVLAWREAGGPS